MTARIVCGPYLYTPTAEDRLWLSRAVAAEGPVHRQVAQTLVNLFAYLHARDPEHWDTLTKLVRAYAQPVNPRWYPGGDLHEKWLGRQPNATDAHARRRRDALSARTDFDARTLDAVHVALEVGPVSIPPNATDYAAQRIDARRKGYREVGRPGAHGNRLWTRDALWRGYRVESAPSSRAMDDECRTDRY